MPKVVTYTCDRCGHGQSTPQNTGEENSRYMWEISIHRYAADSARSSFHNSSMFGVLWCENCVKEFEIPLPLLRANTETAKVTIESMIVEIVKDHLRNEEE